MKADTKFNYPQFMIMKNILFVIYDSKYCSLSRTLNWDLTVDLSEFSAFLNLETSEFLSTIQIYIFNVKSFDNGVLWKLSVQEKNTKMKSADQEIFFSREEVFKFAGGGGGRHILRIFTMKI